MANAQNRHFSKEVQMANKCIENVKHLKPSEKCKSKLH
jgi:hypothetical protein